MPCYRPLEATRAIGSTQKPLVWKRGQRPDPLADGFEALDLPCGKCIGCKLEYSRMWGARCAQEALLHEENCFLTLTYRPEIECDDEQLAKGLHLPRDGSLNKAHHKTFLKRLRHHLGRKRISYYHCGEYGEQTFRPHYHTLVFGFDPPDKKVFKESDGYTLYTSDFLDDVWKFGHVFVGSTTFESACYVARYCLKKITGDQAHEHYLRFDEYGNPYWLEPEYSTMSRNPAIGKRFYEEYRTDMFPLDRNVIPGVGIHGKPPRYYAELHAAVYPDEMALIKEAREEFWRNNPEDVTPGRLLVREAVKIAKVKHFTRGDG